MQNEVSFWHGLMGPGGMYALLGIAVGLLLSRLFRRPEEKVLGLPHREAPRHAGPEPSPAVQELIRSHQLIAAIKLYRTETGLGLKEAKDAVEAWQRRQQQAGT